MKRIYFLAVLLLCPLMSRGQDTLTLDSCRFLAIQNNPALKQMDKRVESADANIRASKKDYFPMIDAGGNYTLLQYPIQVEINDTRYDGPQNLYSLNASIVQNVYSGLSVRKKNELANLQKEYSSSSRENAENNLLLQTELAFWQVVYNRELVTLSGKNREIIDGLVAAIGDKVENEIISRNDLLLLEVRQNEAVLYEQVTANALEVSMLELNRVIGFPQEQVVVPLGQLDSIVLYDAGYSMDSVLSYRPDIVAQQKVVSMQRTQADIVKSKYLPQVYVGIIPEWGAPNTIIGSKNPNYNTSFLAGVNVPITRWGKRQYDVGKELLLADAATYELEDMKDKVTLQVHSSEYQLNDAARRIELTTSSLQKAEGNLEIMSDRYIEGLSSILEVLDAQLYWQRSYKEMLDAQLIYKQALAFHRNAIGAIK